MGGETSPRLIGRYEIDGLLGRGGMGAVYSAHDPAIGRPVAIKLVSEGFRDSSARERLANEARAAGRLQHPHIVMVFDVGEHDGQLFIVMERVLGEPLSSMLSRRPRLLDVPTGLTLIEQACEALAYAHQLGTVHLDIKPDNLMVTRAGQVKILDFGIAHVGGDDVTRTSSIVGSLRYMAPEQLTSSMTLDRRADVFAVGCVLYELVAGAPPFEGRIKDAVARVLGDDPRPLVEVVPNIDPELSALVARMMARDPKGRPSDLLDVARQLSSIRARLTGQPTIVRPLIRESTVIGAPASRPVLSGFTIATGVLLLAGGVGAWLFTRSAASPTQSSLSAPAQEPVEQTGAQSSTSAQPRDASQPSESVVASARPGAAPSPSSSASSTDARRTQDARQAPQTDSKVSARDTSSREITPQPTSPLPPNAAPEPPASAASSDSRPTTDPASRDTAATPVPPAPPLVRGAPSASSQLPSAPVSEEARVLDALNRYKRAFEERRVEALEDVYPALTQEQRARLRRDLAGVDRYQIDYADTQVAVRGDTATVTAIVTREMQPRVGRLQRNATPTTFHFRKAGDAWVIDAITAR